MDPGVLEAMRRWPNVPAVYGWLSLTPRGEWRLHPQGDAIQGGHGEGISNEQILSFINRNYSGGDDGCWFFQNGPQRVFVRIDAAPLILRVDASTGKIVSHVGQSIEQIRRWWLDERGRLFAQTDTGPGMVDDRDLMQLSESLQSPKGDNLLDVMEAIGFCEDVPPESATMNGTSCRLPAASLILSDQTGWFPALQQPAPIEMTDSRHIAAIMGFVSNPSHESTHPPS